MTFSSRVIAGSTSCGQAEFGFGDNLWSFATVHGAHTTILDTAGVADYRSVIGYFARTIMKELRLVSGDDVLFGKIKAFVQTDLFDHTVDLEHPNTLRNLSDLAATNSFPHLSDTGKVCPGGFFSRKAKRLSTNSHCGSKCSPRKIIQVCHLWLRPRASYLLDGVFRVDNLAFPGKVIHNGMNP